MGGRGRPRRDAAWNPPSKGGDVTALFAVLVSVPLLLPLLPGFGYVLFALPVLVMAIAAPRCLAAARRSAHPLLWRTYALAAVPGGAAAAGATASGPPSRRRTGWWLMGVCAAAAVGDGFVAAGGSSFAFTAVCWTASSLALAAAASDRRSIVDDGEEDARARFVLARIVLPLIGVLAFPVAATVVNASHGLSGSAAIYFACFFV